MTWSRSFRWLLPLVCLLLAGPAALSAEEADLGCLFDTPLAENASSEPALLAVEGLPAPLPASTPCGTCSLPGCRFRTRPHWVGPQQVTALDGAAGDVDECAFFWDEAEWS